MKKIIRIFKKFNTKPFVTKLRYEEHKINIYSDNRTINLYSVSSGMWWT